MNGFVTLANNFISYCGLITTALNSMAGRFVLISVKRGNLKEAVGYYTSVYFGDWIITAILLIPTAIFVARIENFLNINSQVVGDVRLLFSLTFLNFFLQLCVPKWTMATYVTNNLYLRSVKTMCTAVLRAFIILGLLIVFEPAAYFVAIAGVIQTVANLIFEYNFKKQLLPELKVKLSLFRFKKVKELIASGIWNSIGKCGNLLLEGLDLLLANLFVDSVAMGILSLSKIIPNMLNQLIGTVATTFGPKLTYHYADGRLDLAREEIEKDIKIISIMVTVPIGVTMIYGKQFFSLWVPSQNSSLLMSLTILALLGMIFTCINQCLINVFGVVNKLRFHSLVVIFSGLVNVLIVFVLLKCTNLGILAITGVSSFVSILREMIFTAPYAAKCLNQKWYTFIPHVLKATCRTIIPILIGIPIHIVFSQTTWLHFFVGAGSTAIIALVVECWVILSKEERMQLYSIVQKKFNKKR